LEPIGRKLVRKFSEWATSDYGIVSGLFVAAGGIAAMGIGMYVLVALASFIPHHPRLSIAGAAFLAAEWGYWRWAEAVKSPGRRKRDPNVCSKCGRPYWKDVSGPADETASVDPKSPGA
jgi:hypothetical protein